MYVEILESLVQILTPQVVVFYNGTREEPDVSELKLSDAFCGGGRYSPAIECTATDMEVV